MESKIHLSVRAKVVYILHINAGKWLCISEIRAIYQKRYKRSIKSITINRAIQENNYLNDNIQISTERRYRSRRPIRVYSIAPLDPQTYLFQ